MTLAEFLQQLVADQSPLFVLTQTIGDPHLAVYGEVWTAQGGLLVYNNGKTLEGSAQINRIIPTNPAQHEVYLSLDVDSGTLTIQNQGGLGGIWANHLQLQYFNGVLYGTATHFGYDPDTPTNCATRGSL